QKRINYYNIEEPQPVLEEPQPVYGKSHYFHMVAKTGYRSNDRNFTSKA
ncbi:hypothetical protein RRG08_063556, partial [Elysia crispata]